MNEEGISVHDVMADYQRHAPGYDSAVHRFDHFAWFGFNISSWRAAAIASLNLKPGDTVVDIGCGTGLNFPLLHQAVGPEGSIIGVDLSDEMLQQARARASAIQSDNIHLVCADAAQFAYPPQVAGVLSTFALILVSNGDRAVGNACRALASEGRLVVLDMAWPNFCPLWWRHVLFFLQKYGVTKEILHRRPWETVQQTMQGSLRCITQQSFWFGFFYLWTGSAASDSYAWSADVSHDMDTL